MDGQDGRALVVYVLSLGIERSTTRWKDSNAGLCVDGDDEEQAMAARCDATARKKRARGLSEKQPESDSRVGSETTGQELAAWMLKRAMFERRARGDRKGLLVGQMDAKARQAAECAEKRRR